MSSKHILLLPLMAQGHLKPFLQLAHRIKERTRGLTITILSTPLNIQILNEMSFDDADSSEQYEAGSPCSVIRLVELPFRSSDYGLPDKAENTNVLPLKDMIKLLNASKSLEAPMRRYIDEEIVRKEGCPPLCIISDWFLGWAVQVANSFRSLAFTFSTAGAYGTAAYISIWRDLPHLTHLHCKGENDDFVLPGFPKMHVFQQSHLSPVARAAGGTDEWSKFFNPQMSMSMASNGWLCNTVEEFEPLGLSILRNYLSLPVWAVGASAGQLAEMQPRDVKMIIRWLDMQPNDSVLYISFGSQNTIRLSHMLELAAGLEDSGKRFLWVIRPPLGFDVESEFRPDWLPTGFLERTVNKGLLVHKWAPQMEILAHNSTGAFMSHCGWNSVLEALSKGVPMIGWPLAAEQAFNSKMLDEEAQVTVEVARGLDGKVTKDDIKWAVNMALDRHGKGGDLKRKAKEMADTLHKGSALHSIDDFLHCVFTKVIFDCIVMDNKNSRVYPISKLPLK